MFTLTEKIDKNIDCASITNNHLSNKLCKWYNCFFPKQYPSLISTLDFSRESPLSFLMVVVRLPVSATTSSLCWVLTICVLTHDQSDSIRAFPEMWFMDPGKEKFLFPGDWELRITQSRDARWLFWTPLKIRRNYKLKSMQTWVMAREREKSNNIL